MCHKTNEITIAIYEYTVYFRYLAMKKLCFKITLLFSLVLSIYRYIVDTDMTDVSIQSGQSMTALAILLFSNIMLVVFTYQL